MEHTSLVTKTKILATLGPSSVSVLTALVNNGVNAVRLNFSHSTEEEHKKTIGIIKSIEKEFQTPLTIIQDLQGPKIRLGILQQETVILTKNMSLVLFFGKEQIDQRIPVQVNIFSHLKKNDHILINDGLVTMVVEEVKNSEAKCRVITPGEIRSNKGVNLPDTHFTNIALTEKDKKDLAVGLESGVDYVAVSFVQSAEDIEQVRHLILAHAHHPKIIAKIETAAAIHHLSSIIETSDGVMVARGDLAVEIGQEEVPIIQREIIRLAKKHNKLVIIATQMLESMIHNPGPTRAEVNDVATAVLDEVDAVMLSAETAIGNYPVETVSMMHKIIRRVENYYTESHKTYELPSIDDFEDQTTAIAAAASVLAHQLQAKIILALTTSGKTAQRLASYRSSIPLVAITDDKLVYTQLALIWNVTPYFVEKITDNQQAFNMIIKKLKNSHSISSNDRIVLVTGSHPGKAGHTNTISVTTVSEQA